MPSFDGGAWAGVPSHMDGACGGVALQKIFVFSFLWKWCFFFSASA